MVRAADPLVDDKGSTWDHIRAYEISNVAPPG